jgi:hypothetical protein
VEAYLSPQSAMARMETPFPDLAKVALKHMLRDNPRAELLLNEYDRGLWDIKIDARYPGLVSRPAAVN